MLTLTVWLPHLSSEHPLLFSLPALSSCAALGSFCAQGDGLPLCVLVQFVSYAYMFFFPSAFPSSCSGHSYLSIKYRLKCHFFQETALNSWTVLISDLAAVPYLWDIPHSCLYDKGLLFRVHVSYPLGSKLGKMKTGLDHSGLGNSILVTDMFSSIRTKEMDVSNPGRKSVLVG